MKIGINNKNIIKIASTKTCADFPIYNIYKNTRI